MHRLSCAVAVCRYGWHFPELTKIIDSNIKYASIVKFMGSRDKAAELDFSAILDEDVEEKLKEVAVVSMGTEMSEEDLAHISSLCDQVIELTEYRTQLYNYLRNRMQVCFHVHASLSSNTQYLIALHHC
jgi:nucleolar protein 58